MTTAISIIILSLLALGWVFRFTRIGLAKRAERKKAESKARNHRNLHDGRPCGNPAHNYTLS